MAMFMTRVELHDANWNDYVNLHAAMAKQGFTTTITGSNGIVYDLPPAEYHLIGNLAANDVLARAQTAAGTVKRSHAVIVSETVGSTWNGLKVATPSSGLAYSR